MGLHARSGRAARPGSSAAGVAVEAFRVGQVQHRVRRPVGTTLHALVLGRQEPAAVALPWPRRSAARRSRWSARRTRAGSGRLAAQAVQWTTQPKLGRPNCRANPLFIMHLRRRVIEFASVCTDRTTVRCRRRSWPWRPATASLSSQAALAVLGGTAELRCRAGLRVRRLMNASAVALQQVGSSGQFSPSPLGPVPACSRTVPGAMVPRTCEQVDDPLRFRREVRLVAGASGSGRVDRRVLAASHVDPAAIAPRPRPHCAEEPAAGGEQGRRCALGEYLG